MGRKFRHGIWKVPKWNGMEDFKNGMVVNRGGVEDTRLEAKAKHTKKSEANVKDTPSVDKPSRGQGQECLKPRTKDTTPKCSPKKKEKVFAQKFANFPQNSSVQKFFFASSLACSKTKLYYSYNLDPFSRSQKIVLSSSRGQSIFEDLPGLRPRPKT